MNNNNLNNSNTSNKQNKPNDIDPSSSQSQEMDFEIVEKIKSSNEMNNEKEMMEFIQKEKLMNNETPSTAEMIGEIKEIDVEVLPEWTNDEIKIFLHYVKENEIHTPQKDLRMLFIKINTRLLEKQITHIWVFYQFYLYCKKSNIECNQNQWNIFRSEVMNGIITIVSDLYNFHDWISNIEEYITTINTMNIEQEKQPIEQINQQQEQIDSNNLLIDVGNQQQNTTNEEQRKQNDLESNGTPIERIIISIKLTNNCCINCCRIDNMSIEGLYLLTVTVEDINQTIIMISQELTNVKLTTNEIERLNKYYLVLHQSLEICTKEKCTHFQFLFDMNTYSLNLNI